MISLADEFRRLPSIFTPSAAISDLGIRNSKTWSSFCLGKNGVVAISGALVCFGLGPKVTPVDLRWYKYHWKQRSYYKNIFEFDFVLGCDVFGDLLFEREGALFRLDGESGDIECLLDNIEEFGAMSLSDAADLFGGRPAKLAFAGCYLGDDLIRLMPQPPFLIAGETAHSHRIIDLPTLLEKKAKLAKNVENLNDGDTLDLSFWNE